MHTVGQTCMHAKGQLAQGCHTARSMPQAACPVYPGCAARFIGAPLAPCMPHMPHMLHMLVQCLIDGRIRLCLALLVVLPDAGPAALSQRALRATSRHS